MYDFKTVEPKILKFWDKNKIYAKVKDKVKGKKPYYFLDGPPYTSGKVHIGTAWNKALKDLVLRYKRMRGYDVWDRAGYDMHGLPTEHATQKKLKLGDKQDIEKYGVAKFIKECEKLSIENMKVMNEDFTRLGVWMDFENAYQSITKEFIEGEWWLVKKAHDNGRLYEGLRTITWCASCATALAKHELEYKNVSDESIFVKFKVKDAEKSKISGTTKSGQDNLYLIIWTTTPWTIPLNLAIMVNPELEYVKCDVKNEVWIIAKALAAPLVQSVVGDELRILEEFKGDKLEGMEYEHPLADIVDYKKIKKKAPKTHTVVMSTEYVDTSAGSGLVHCAPGCGPEDYEVGHTNGIPPYNPLSETGVFPKDMGKFSGLVAKKDDVKFVEELDKKGALIAKTMVEHDYAHCWRCHEPVIFRATKQWFFKVEDIKQEMINENKSIKWVPEAAFNAFDSWLNNLRDNSITKQRFWGTPLPVWRCECGQYDVIATVDEIKKLAGKAPADLHKPWIDEITYPCKCGKVKKRIPDILDVWVDAGTTSWNCLDYPHRTDLFDKLFPAEFILEGKDQIRGWFNLLMVASMVSMKRPSFKNVYMHGFVQDAEGRKMSKSLGNYILPEEVVDKYGADTLRYYMIGGTTPGVDINYNFEDMKVKHKNLTILWNLHVYVLSLAKELGVNPAKLKVKELDVEEKYILSKLNSTIDLLTGIMDNYMVNEAPWLAEALFLELSRVYIQFVREKAAMGSKKDKEKVLYTIYNVLLESLKLLAPVMPFITEEIYLSLKNEFKLDVGSVHLYDWPKAVEHLVDKELEADIETVKLIVQAALFAREKIQLGVRWPLKELIVVSAKDDVKRVVSSLGEIVKTHTNVKEIKVVDKLKGMETTVRADFAKIKAEFGGMATKIIAELATVASSTLSKKIEEEGKYVVKIEGAKISLVRDHFVFETKVPENYMAVESRVGFVLLNKDTDPNLEAEGVARELMRRVQALRKKAGLQKTDRITLHLQTAEPEKLNKWKEQIALKCGADAITVSKEAEKLEHSSKEKIKGKEYGIWFG